MKKLIAVILVLCLAASLTACGVSANFTSTKTVSSTTTDANGNTTTTTSTVTNNNGNVTESNSTVTTPAEPDYVTCAKLAEDGENHSFPVHLTNGTKYNLTAIYIVPTGANAKDGTNMLGDKVLEPGMDITANCVYNKDYLVFDIYVYFNDTEYVSFTECNFSNMAADIEAFERILIETETNTFRLETAA